MTRTSSQRRTVSAGYHLDNALHYTSSYSFRSRCNLTLKPISRHQTTLDETHNLACFFQRGRSRTTPALTWRNKLSAVNIVWSMSTSYSSSLTCYQVKQPYVCTGVKPFCKSKQNINLSVGTRSLDMATNLALPKPTLKL